MTFLSTETIVSIKGSPWDMLVEQTMPFLSDVLRRRSCLEQILVDGDKSRVVTVMSITIPSNWIT